VASEPPRVYDATTGRAVGDLVSAGAR